MNLEPTMENLLAAHHALREACDKAVQDLARLYEPSRVPEAQAVDPSTTPESSL